MKKILDLCVSAGRTVDHEDLGEIKSKVCPLSMQEPPCI